MLAEERKKATAEIIALEESGRLKWVRPKIRTLATRDAELLSNSTSDGGSSFS
jgi:hypothetical protein